MEESNTASDKLDAAMSEILERIAFVSDGINKASSSGAARDLSEAVERLAHAYAELSGL